MATQNSTGTPERVDHYRPTARSHYAHMRCAEQSARNISVRLSVRGFLASESADVIADLQATQTSHYLLAAAYRSAGRRRERAERRAAHRKLFRQEPARYFRLTAREMQSTVRAAFRRIVKAVSA
ncbi:hypothetical protein [Streptomyces sp. NPDC050704]|uniref:hypothetical protein n=1 Tax=Streptomyces sp. NPDC050704 TaxID=3157219 RepID=UPI003446EDA0